MKTLSISVAAFNAEKWIEQCLDSFCIPEIIDDIEVLVINDGSTDHTKEYAQNYVSRYPNSFRLINKVNGGHGSTINTGIKAASGKYFKLVDADDWVEREGIIDLVKKAECCTADAIISPYYKFFITSKDLQLQRVFYNKFNEYHYINHEIEIEKVAEECEFGLHTLTFRTSLLKDNFTEITENCFYVDMEYVAFYSCYISKAFISDVPVYVYRLGNDGQSIALNNMIKRREQHFIVCKKLMEFYDDVSGTVSDANLQIIKRMIGNVFAKQIYILLEIDDKRQSKNELYSFIVYVKTNYLSLYNEIIKYGKKEKKESIILASIMDNTGFHLYGLVYKIIHFLKK